MTEPKRNEIIARWREPGSESDERTRGTHGARGIVGCARGCKCIGAGAGGFEREFERCAEQPGAESAGCAERGHAWHEPRGGASQRRRCDR